MSELSSAASSCELTSNSPMKADGPLRCPQLIGDTLGIIR